MHRSVKQMEAVRQTNTGTFIFLAVVLTTIISEAEDGNSENTWNEISFSLKMKSFKSRNGTTRGEKEKEE